MDKYERRNKKQWDDNQHDDKYVVTKRTIDCDARKNYKDEPKLKKE